MRMPVMPRSFFTLYKFRSMYTNAEADSGAVCATKDDPRITPVGRWLRKLRLDEIPQLFNVIRGEMSLVGPRPHAAAHNTKYEKEIANYAFRHHVKPGITGWAQVNGYRGETKTIDLMKQRVEHDLWYVNNWGLILDMKILMRTIIVSVQGDSAY